MTAEKILKDLMDRTGLTKQEALDKLQDLAKGVKAIKEAKAKKEVKKPVVKKEKEVDEPINPNAPIFNNFTVPISMLNTLIYDTKKGDVATLKVKTDLGMLTRKFKVIKHVEKVNDMRKKRSSLSSEFWSYNNEYEEFGTVTVEDVETKVKYEVSYHAAGDGPDDVQYSDNYYIFSRFIK